jgi:hypothetical protein
MTTEEKLKRVLRDYDYDERVSRTLCRRVLPERKINGGDIGVPTLAALVEMLVLEIERLRCKSCKTDSFDKPK